MNALTLDKVKADAAELEKLFQAATNIDDFQTEITHVVTVSGMKVPVYVLPNAAAIKLMDEQRIPKICADHGLLIHLMSEYYKALRQQDKFQARELIRKVTSHNGKLGFNWDIKGIGYVTVPTDQK